MTGFAKRDIAGMRLSIIELERNLLVAPFVLTKKLFLGLMTLRQLILMSQEKQMDGIPLLSHLEVELDATGNAIWGIGGQSRLTHKRDLMAALCVQTKFS
jgi:hypothetical protein